MGKILLKGFRNFQFSDNTRAEFVREVQLDEIKNILNKFSKAILNKNKVCYVYGMGAHPKSTYTALKNLPGLKLIFFRSVLPKKIRILSWLIASYEGLIKIEDLSKLPDIFLVLMKQSMVGVYFMSAELETSFLSSLSAEHEHKFIDFGIKADPGYSFYLVDADNIESSTGMVEIVSYGHQVIPDFIPVIE